MCLLDRQDHRTDPWVQGQTEQAGSGNLLRVIPTTRVVLGGIHLRGTLGKILDRPEGEIHLDLLARTSRCLLLAAHQGKARSGKGRPERQGQKETAPMGKERGLRAAVQEFLQTDNARGTVQAPRGWKETDPELPVRDTVQVLRDQQGSRRVLREAPGTAQALQDQRGTGTAPGLLAQTIHRCSQLELRAGWELLGRNRAIPGSELQGDCWQGPWG